MQRRVSLNEFRSIVQKMPRKLNQAFAAGLRDAADVLAVEVRNQIRAVRAVDTEDLLDSVHVRKGLGGATVSVDAPHARFVEEGTRPHMPPVKPLEEWALRHGMEPGTGWAIAKKIAERGTPPRRYFARATVAAAGRMTEKITSALDRAGEGHVVSRGRIEGKLRSALRSQ